MPESRPNVLFESMNVYRELFKCGQPISYKISWHCYFLFWCSSICGAFRRGFSVPEFKLLDSGLENVRKVFHLPYHFLFVEDCNLMFNKLDTSRRISSHLQAYQGRYRHIFLFMYKFVCPIIFMNWLIDYIGRYQNSINCYHHRRHHCNHHIVIIIIITIKVHYVKIII